MYDNTMRLNVVSHAAVFVSSRALRYQKKKCCLEDSPCIVYSPGGGW